MRFSALIALALLASPALGAPIGSSKKPRPVPAKPAPKPAAPAPGPAKPAATKPKPTPESEPDAEGSGNGGISGILPGFATAGTDIIPVIVGGYQDRQALSASISAQAALQSASLSAQAAEATATLTPAAAPSAPTRRMVRRTAKSRLSGKESSGSKPAGKKPSISINPAIGNPVLDGTGKVLASVIAGTNERSLIIEGASAQLSLLSASVATTAQASASAPASVTTALTSA
ncbi:hypothetical protein GLOTRDRAFT_131018 [Gloeophyllum trabeum ATCC 11539]|uniref:Uncharacterized protein n=1 Tax=Gloeophyllum trabeum (strain ATCC 11539 / FP-39264 / Madison 617) TaxID=670483 RepID=S7Q285_GLOTA|nr:uncharacterized protein GLOTRDRAFT_131018 [Gloeophyllum trabeum ATCC 11539]EPQ53678.1 hypothetical protein GLOTRDRAFT_131018 [Gloeophyllum trabeum ATCC 11539]